MADANLGSDLISVIGGGANGFDVNAMVNGLVAAERTPATARLDRQEQTAQTKLDAYNAVQTAISGFKSLLADVNDLQTLQARSVTSSDSSVFTASANTSGTLASPGSYQVEVTGLAASHSVYSDSFTNSSDAVGEGTLTFKFGTTDYDASTDTYTSFTETSGSSSHTITIDSTNNSLQGLRDTINSADIGVTASIVNDGTGYRLVMSSSSTGAANSMEIVASDNDGDNTDNSGISRFTFNSSATHMAQSSAATNASATVNGLTITSDTNTLSSAVEGLTIDLHGTSVGTTHTLTVAHDTDSVKTAITNFVGDYNALMTVFDEYAKYDVVTAGALQGESLVRSIINDIKYGVSEALESMPSGLQTLTDIGVSKDRYGKMSLDTTKLDEVLSSDFDVVGRIFARGGDADDSLISYTSATSDTVVGSYDVNITSNHIEAVDATSGAYNGYAVPPSSGYYTGDDDSYLEGSIEVSADDDNYWFEMTLDGVTSNDRIYLTEKTYTDAEELAVELQTQINADSNFSNAGKSVTVAVDRSGADPRFVITSDSTGTSSSVEITDGDSRIDNDLGLNDGSAVSTPGGGAYLEDTVEIDSANNAFKINIDGTDSSGWIYLTQDTYADAETLASHMESQINADSAFTSGGQSVTVTVDRTGTNPHFVITSASTGTSSSVTFTDVDTNTAAELGLGHTSATATTGTDAVAGSTLSGTINGQPAIVEDDYFLRSLTGDSLGLTIEVRGTAVGDRGQIHYTEGYATKLDNLLENVLEKGQSLDLRIDTLNNKLDDITEQREELDVRITKMEARWRRQFNALNALMGQMESTGNFLTQTFKAMSGNNN